MEESKPKKKRPMTASERTRKFQDNYASIDAYMDDRFKEVDWNRRNYAEQNLNNWVKAYCVGLLLTDEPPELGNVVLGQMESTITSHENYMICMARGSGKSSYVQCTALYALAKGIQKYVVIISNNQRAANGMLEDIFRAIAEVDTPFSNDYPEICAPFQLVNGSFHRKQTYRGLTTDIQKVSDQMVFPRMKKDDGSEFATSGSVIACRGITSGLRGMKHGTLRPSFAILDDLQTSETASNPNAVDKILDLIRKDIMPLAGKERLSILQTATPILPEDLVQKIKEDKSWKTTIYPAIINYPTNLKLWSEYFNLYDEELTTGENHTNSLQFYIEHQKEMDEGSEVFNPMRFSTKDGHISAIQKLMELKHTIGEAAFDSEYMMNPKALQFSLPITPTIVTSRKSSIKELEIPSENVAWVCASSDLNLSKYITTTIVVFLRNHTSIVVWHKFRKCSIPMNIPEQDYYQRVYNLLGEHGKELKKLGIKIDGWVIDANGAPYKAVLDFCRNSTKICGLSAAGFIGKASHQYRSFIRSRLKDDVNRTLLCGDEDEHKKSGSGRKYTYFDSDLYHEKVQKGFLQEVGNIGSISFYNGNDHSKWAIQICAERLMFKKSRGDGTIEYTWKEVGEDHDALDSIGQALAAFASQGFASSDTGRTSMSVNKRLAKKKVVKIV